MSVSNERLAEIIEWAMGEEAECLQDDMPVSAGYYADVVRLLLSRRSASNTGGVEVKDIEIGRKLIEGYRRSGMDSDVEFWKRILSSLAAEAEPVAWRYSSGWVTVPEMVKLWLCTSDQALAEREAASGNVVQPLYTRPSSSVSAEVTEGAWNEFTEAHRRHFPYPDGTEIEVTGRDTQYRSDFSKVMRVRSPQWNGHAPYISFWRLPRTALNGGRENG